MISLSVTCGHLWKVRGATRAGEGHGLRAFPPTTEGMTPDAVSRRKSELAIWLREGLVKLGPTFIKIGQQFSTRVDVLSKEFVRELE